MLQQNILCTHLSYNREHFYGTSILQHFESCFHSSLLFNFCHVYSIHFMYQETKGEQSKAKAITTFNTKFDNLEHAYKNI